MNVWARVRIPHINTFVLQLRDKIFYELALGLVSNIYPKQLIL